MDGASILQCGRCPRLRPAWPTRDGLARELRRFIFRDTHLPAKLAVTSETSNARCPAIHEA